MVSSPHSVHQILQNQRPQDPPSSESMTRMGWIRAWTRIRRHPNRRCQGSRWTQRRSRRTAAVRAHLVVMVWSCLLIIIFCWVVLIVLLWLLRLLVALLWLGESKWIKCRRSERCGSLTMGGLRRRWKGRWFPWIQLQLQLIPKRRRDAVSSRRIQVTFSCYVP